MSITRRTILIGAAAIAAVTAANSLIEPFQSPAADPLMDDEKEKLDTFVELSVILTGIKKEKLAPGVDPIDIKRAYFDQAKGDPAFPSLLDFFRKNKSPDPGADIFHHSDLNLRYLARSIMLAWYLGAWYDPSVLRNPPPGSIGLPCKVISPAAYTQGWIWRVAQAHPMGYSELQFGYWSSKPTDLSNPLNFMVC